MSGDDGARVTGSQGVQAGHHNTQINLNIDPDAVLPPAASLAVAPGTDNLPAISRVFVGRNLADLDGPLSAGRGVIGQAVQGLGGIGKTELAAHYAQHHRNRYPLIWWITADTPESITVGLAALTSRLHPIPSLAQGEAWAITWLQTHPGWLLVLDNVEDPLHITTLLGHLDNRGQVLVTTRRNVGTGRWRRLGLVPLRLGVLDRAASVDLLCQLTDLDDAAGASRLAADLGDLPLALEQAAAYIGQHHRMTFDAYRNLLATRFTRIVTDPGEGGCPERTIGRVWHITMATIEVRSPIAAKTLSVLAYLAPDNLPADILAPLTDDPADLADALALLDSYTMITRKDGTVSVHRLVQAVTRAANPEQHGLDDAIRLLKDAAPHDPMSNVVGWPRWHVLLPHIDMVTTHLPDNHTNVDILDVIDRAATFLRGQGQHARSIDLFQRVLADRERILGVEHPDTISARANLAASYWQAGRTSDAIPMQEGVVADSERILGVEHPDTISAAETLRQWKSGG